MIISMSIHVHDCPIFSGSPAAPSHNTRPSETHMRYLHATDLHIERKTPLRPQSLRRNRPITEATVESESIRLKELHQNHFDVPTIQSCPHLGQLTKVIPSSTRNLPHWNDTFDAEKHAWEKMLKSLKMIEDVQSHSTLLLAVFWKM